jgi:hypothetical protein
MPARFSREARRMARRGGTVGPRCLGGTAGWHWRASAFFARNLWHRTANNASAHSLFTAPVYGSPCLQALFRAARASPWHATPTERSRKIERRPSLRLLKQAGQLIVQDGRAGDQALAGGRRDGSPCLAENDLAGGKIPELRPGTDARVGVDSAFCSHSCISRRSAPGESKKSFRQRRTRPASPVSASCRTSSSDTRLKSPGIECFRQDAAAANSTIF